MKSITYCLLLPILFLISCGSNVDNKEVILATTTSVQDSGLLDVLTDIFKKETGYKIKAIAVGSGEAMAMGRRGDADVMLVHSPAAEEIFMKDGFGKSCATFMYNYFVIVGPVDDPAGCSKTVSATEAFSRIAATSSPFISRGDNSGTHIKEMSLWNETGIKPKDKWYIQTKNGMGIVLQIANEKRGYTLTDRATYLAFRQKLSLREMVDQDPALLNQYSVIVLNPDKFPKVNLTGAEAWAKFLLEPGTQKIIGEYGKDKYGEALFYTK